MTKQKKSQDKAKVDVKDLGAKNNPKGGAPSISEITVTKQVDVASNLNTTTTSK